MKHHKCVVPDSSSDCSKSNSSAVCGCCCCMSCELSSSSSSSPPNISFSINSLPSSPVSATCSSSSSSDTLLIRRRLCYMETDRHIKTNTDRETSRNRHANTHSNTHTQTDMRTHNPLLILVIYWTKLNENRKYQKQITKTYKLTEQQRETDVETERDSSVCTSCVLHAWSKPTHDACGVSWRGLECWPTPQTEKESDKWTKAHKDKASNKDKDTDPVNPDTKVLFNQVIILLFKILINVRVVTMAPFSGVTRGIVIQRSFISTPFSLIFNIIIYQLWQVLIQCFII